MEEFITGELDIDEQAAISRAQELIGQLLGTAEDGGTQPVPSEMAKCALRALKLPEIEAARPSLVPEPAIWGAGDGYLLAGRADALAIRDGRVEIAIEEVGC